MNGGVVDLTTVDDDDDNGNDIYVSRPKAQSSSLIDMTIDDDDDCNSKLSGCVFVSKDSASSDANNHNDNNKNDNNDDEEDRKLPAKSQPALVLSSDDDSDNNDDIQVVIPAVATLPTAPLPPPSKHDNDDHTLAMALQSQEEVALQQWKRQQQQQSETAMKSSTTGRAWNFVERVLQFVQQWPSTTTNIQAVAVDDMVYLAERFLECQSLWLAKKNYYNATVDLGFHYTRSVNLSRIRTDGLLSNQERNNRGIQSHYNGSAYGDGIYTAASPLSYSKYGDTGLIVARIQGRIEEFPAVRKLDGTRHDTLVVQRGMPGEFAVLAKSCQCLPLIQFAAPTSMFWDAQHGGWTGMVGGATPTMDTIYDLHVQLQQLVDECFNQAVATPVPNWNESAAAGGGSMVRNALAAAALAASAPAGLSSFSTHMLKQQIQGAAKPFTVAPPNAAINPLPVVTTTMPTAYPRKRTALSRRAPRVKKKVRVVGYGMPTAGAGSTHNTTQSRVIASIHPGQETVNYVAPESLAVAPEKTFRVIVEATHTLLQDECPLCLDTYAYQGKIARLFACGHHFHRSCIENSLIHSTLCPTCRKPVSEPRGKMPSGAMSISRIATCCSGYESYGSIVIQYNLCGGQQKQYHPNPGQYHGSAIRTAYIPDTNQGTDLLKRLKYAFQRGLTFTVGTSMTTGATNCVTWASIHHKTSQTGGVGAHGFPDAQFFTNCNAELDAAHVPPTYRLQS